MRLQFGACLTVVAATSLFAEMVSVNDLAPYERGQEATDFWDLHEHPELKVSQSASDAGTLTFGGRMETPSTADCALEARYFTQEESATCGIRRNDPTGGILIVK